MQCNSSRYCSCFRETQGWRWYTAYKTSGGKRVKCDCSCRSPFTGIRLLPFFFAKSLISLFWTLGNATLLVSDSVISLTFTLQLTKYFRFKSRIKVSRIFRDWNRSVKVYHSSHCQKSENWFRAGDRSEATEIQTGTITSETYYSEKSFRMSSLQKPEPVDSSSMAVMLQIFWAACTLPTGFLNCLTFEKM